MTCLQVGEHLAFYLISYKQKVGILYLIKNCISHKFNPTALRKAKIVYSFGLSECNRVKDVILSMLDKLMNVRYPYIHIQTEAGSYRCEFSVVSKL